MRLGMEFNAVLLREEELFVFERGGLGLCLSRLLLLINFYFKE